MERANWKLLREYKDAQGNVHLEYRDAQGKVRAYKMGYMDNQLIEEEWQNHREKQADRNISKGVLMGIIVACVGGLVAGTVYMMTRPNVPQPAAVIVPNYAKSPLSSAPQTQVNEKPNVTIVNIPQPPGTPSATNNMNQPVTAPKPATANPSSVAAKPLVATAPANETALTPSQINNTLKNAAIKQLQASFPNNQLVVEVKDTNITVSGTTQTAAQLQQIQPTLSSIQGIGKITVTATVKDN
ncbi:hypothetical protein [Synechococcus sp. PCC 6312]|uniref:hypothetical protein n=1 Tax=Synechococcus sp. (strain ATCC 27167 / PCC 6312) TaxID=195253 RepID=UPI00029EFD9D|nr:hypothetical protein [Synechococcus sp. PCC 6312]AFY62205.1 putative phospholipid-binding protein [Synechococcus sp. PCC 6312]